MAKDAKLFRKEAAKSERVARGIPDVEVAQSLLNLAEAYRRQADAIKKRRRKRNGRTKSSAGLRMSHDGHIRRRRLDRDGIDDLKAAIECGSSVQEAAECLCRADSVEDVARKCEELGLKPKAKS
jgi:hypothetical protein